MGISIGFGTVMAAFLTAFAAISLEWLPDPGVPEHPTFSVLKPLARKLLVVLRMTATYDPQGSTLEQAMASIREKMAAASRQRPTTLQLLFSFTRRISEMLAGGSRRPGPHALAVSGGLSAGATRHHSNFCMGGLSCSLASLAALSAQVPERSPRGDRQAVQRQGAGEHLQDQPGRSSCLEVYGASRGGHPPGDQTGVGTRAREPLCHSDESPGCPLSG